MLYHLNVLGCEVPVYVCAPSMHRATAPTSTLVKGKTAPDIRKKK